MGDLGGEGGCLKEGSNSESDVDVSSSYWEEKEKKKQPIRTRTGPDLSCHNPSSESDPIIYNNK